MITHHLAPVSPAQVFPEEQRADGGEKGSATDKRAARNTRIFLNRAAHYDRLPKFSFAAISNTDRHKHFKCHTALLSLEKCNELNKFCVFFLSSKKETASTISAIRVLVSPLQLQEASKQTAIGAVSHIQTADYSRPFPLYIRAGMELSSDPN